MLKEIKMKGAASGQDDFNESIFYNLMAEGEIIGALLFDNNSIGVVGEFLRKGHFYSPLHSSIYEIIEALINKRRVAEPLTVSNNLSADKTFTEAGGVEYLYSLAKRYSESSFAINIVDRAKLLEGLYYERQLSSILKNAQNDLKNKQAGEEAREKLERIEKALYDLAAETEKDKGGFDSLKNLVDFSIAHIKKIKETGGVRGIPVGFAEIDGIISGWQNSDLIIIAGRPSMGKTSFAISVAINAAKFVQEEVALKKATEGVVAVFSLEMAAEQLATRILSVHSGINSGDLLSGKLDNSEIAKIVKTADEFKHLPIFIDDTPAITIGTVRSRARRLKRQMGLKMIVVDYLQLLRTNGRQENRVQEVSEITQGLKAIAKELNVPVIALSQLSRNVESREDKRPQLQDLRESGSIEQDADIVMFLYREEYYLERTRPHKSNAEATAKWEAENRIKLEKVENTAEIMIAKHRNGAVGSANVRFDKETTKFENLAPTYMMNAYAGNQPSPKSIGENQSFGEAHTYIPSKKKALS